MKGTNIGEFEELVLLVVGILKGKAYGVNVMDHIKEESNRSVSVSTVHSALNRLEDKGFVESYFGGQSELRGGRKKRMYRITPYGIATLQEARLQRENLWSQLLTVIPE
ncbi:MAG: PadR family transcriptional regulator [Fulvivirga sp.]